MIALVLLIAGGVGVYFLLTTGDRACERFQEAVTEEYFPGRAVDPEVRDRLEQAIYNEGQFTTREGETVTKPEGCEPP